MENITYSNCTFPVHLRGSLSLSLSLSLSHSLMLLGAGTVEGALAGIRIKFRPSQMGSVKNILFENIRIVDPVVYAIDIIMSSDHVSASN